MDQAILKADVRSRTGKGSARQARREGKIPAIVYSHFSDPTAIAIDPLALRKAVKSSALGFNTVLTIDLNGEGEKTALLKDWQVDPVTRQLLHADFIEIKLDEELDADVPIILTGKSVGVVEESGNLTQLRRNVTVRCKPQDIPPQVEIDVTSLEIGDSIHVSEVKVPANVELVYTQDYTIAVVTPPEEVPATTVEAAAEGELTEEEAAEAAAEGEEGAEGEGEAAEGGEKEEGGEG